MRAVAERQGVSPRVVAQTERTTSRLAVAVADILRDYCHRVAVQLVRDDEPAPTGGDLLDRTIQRYHAAYLAIRQAHDRVQAEATIATIKAMQQAQGQARPA